MAINPISDPRKKKLHAGLQTKSAQMGTDLSKIAKQRAQLQTQQVPKPLSRGPQEGQPQPLAPKPLPAPAQKTSLAGQLDGLEGNKGALAAPGEDTGRDHSNIGDYLVSDDDSRSSRRGRGRDKVSDSRRDAINEMKGRATEEEEAQTPESYMDPEIEAWLRDQMEERDTSEEEALAQELSERQLGQSIADMRAQAAWGGLGGTGAQAALSGDMRRASALDLSQTRLGIQRDARDEAFRGGNLAAGMFDRESGRRFGSDEAGKDRDWRSDEAGIDRDWRSGEAEEDRDWRSGEADEDRDMSREERKAALQREVAQMNAAFAAEGIPMRATINEDGELVIEDDFSGVDAASDLELEPDENLTHYRDNNGDVREVPQPKYIVSPEEAQDYDDDWEEVGESYGKPVYKDAHGNYYIVA